MIAEPRMAMVPDLSMLSVTLQSLLGDGNGVPGPLRLRLLTVLRTRAGREALRPMLSAPGQRRQIPSAVAPLTPTGDLPIETQIEALRANHGDRLRDDLAGIYSHRLPPSWRPAAERPAGWSRALGDVLADMWNGPGRGAWLRSRPILDGESRRIQSAADHGDVHALLNTLSPRIHYSDGVFSLDGRVQVPVHGRQIVLTPMISAPGSIVVENSDPVAVVVGYALPDALTSWTAAPGAIRTSNDALATVIGQVRADLLRLLHKPASMGSLAADLNCAPSTVTHHCNTLEAAGLIQRIRQGKTVWVRHTPRGSELLDLFG